MRIIFIALVSFATIFFNLTCDDGFKNKESLCESYCKKYGPELAQKFVHDPFFRVNFEALNESIRDFDSFFKTYTYLILKPDGIVSESFDKTVKILSEYGFEIVAFDVFEFTPHMVKLFWYYESRFFPVDWFKLFEMVLTEKKSIIFLLHDTRSHEATTSACERLTKLKGSAEVSKRKDWHIRTKIGAGNGPFGFIHTPENPLAMIKELGIIFGEKRCKCFVMKGINYNKTIGSGDVEKLKQSVYEIILPHDLNYEKTKDRLRQYAEMLQEPVKGRFLQFINNESLSWKDFLNFMEENNLIVPKWDVITFCVNRRNW